MSTGDTIGADISAAEPIIAAFVSTLNPAIGVGVHLGLKLLAVAEPAVFNAVAAAISGKPLTDQQVLEKEQALRRLENPQFYFS